MQLHIHASMCRIGEELLRYRWGTTLPALVGITQIAKGAIPQRIELFDTTGLHCKLLVCALKVICIDLL